VGLVSVRFGFLSAVSTYCNPFNILIRFGLRKDCLNIGRNLSFYVFIKRVVGTVVAQWLICYATNRKVAGSIPDGVIGIFH
jgi:hypothetical protein